MALMGLEDPRSIGKGILSCFAVFANQLSPDANVKGTHNAAKIAELKPHSKIDGDTGPLSLQRCNFKS
jgi:hypothetical protein